ncbi:hypothetical protein PRIPAC_85625, partial [Pristionchus pacificus]
RPMQLQPMQHELQHLQPMQHELQHLQPALHPLDNEQHLPPPVAPVFFRPYEIDVYTPPPVVDFSAQPYMVNTIQPVEMEAKPMKPQTRGRKRKQDDVIYEEEAELDTSTNIDHAAYKWTEKNTQPVEMEAMPVKRKSIERKCRRKQAEVTSDEEAQLDTSTNIEHADWTETGEVFTNIVGRLCVLGSLNHYNVTTDEIKRRASKPEGFGLTHIGPLLKRGRVAGTGCELKRLLESHAIFLPPAQFVNRQVYGLTTLSAMLEGESVQLSVDHRELALAHFPFTSIAHLIIRSIGSPAALAAAARDVAAAKASMTAFSDVLNRWTAGGWAECKGRETIVASPLRTFAYATHALGVEECRLMATLFARFMCVFEGELCALLERVNAVGYGSAAHLHQFPPGVDLPSIPAGMMHLPDWTEDAGGSVSFTEISGRLTLNGKKYNVTVAEVRRRVRQPECHNLSILGALLKRAKKAANYEKLFDELKKHHIVLDGRIRRKRARNTTFTAMLEGEALSLVADMEAEVGRSFPVKDLIALIVTYTPQHDVEERRVGFVSASRIAVSLRETVLSLRLPIAERIPHSVREEAHVIFKYCQLTHGYGPDAVISWMGIFSEIFEKTAETLSRG